MMTTLTAVNKAAGQRPKRQGTLALIIVVAVLLLVLSLFAGTASQNTSHQTAKWQSSVSATISDGVSGAVRFGCDQNGVWLSGMMYQGRKPGDCSDKSSIAEKLGLMFSELTDTLSSREVTANLIKLPPELYQKALEWLQTQTVWPPLIPQTSQ